MSEDSSYSDTSTTSTDGYDGGYDTAFIDLPVVESLHLSGNSKKSTPSSSKRSTPRNHATSHTMDFDFNMHIRSFILNKCIAHVNIRESWNNISELREIAPSYFTECESGHLLATLHEEYNVALHGEENTGTITDLCTKIQHMLVLAAGQYEK